MSRRFLVRAPARIHMGILDMKGDLGRIYGSLGVAVKEPATLVEADKYDELVVEGEHSKDAMSYARTFMKSLKLEKGVKIKWGRADARRSLERLVARFASAA